MIGLLAVVGDVYPISLVAARPVRTFPAYSNRSAFHIEQMQTKVLCVIVLVGLLTSVAAGCLSPNAYPKYPIATVSPAANHDTVLERFIAADYNATAQNVNIDTWEVRWINGTALIVNAEGQLKGANNTVSISKTVKRLSSINASNEVMSAYDLRNYTQVQGANANATLYAEAIGKNATVFKVYEQTTQSSSSLTVARVMQFDDIIAITGTTTAQTPTPIPAPIAVPQSPTPTPAPALEPTPEPTATRRPIFPFRPTPTPAP